MNLGSLVAQRPVLKGMNPTSIVQKWNLLSEAWRSSIKIASNSPNASQQRQDAYVEAVAKTHQLIGFMFALRELGPDEFVELEAPDNIFKRETQVSIIGTLSKEMAVCLNNLGGCILDIREPHFNEAAQAFLWALDWDEKNEYAIDNVWYCLDLADKWMAARQIRVPRNQSNESWVREHNLGYETLKSPSGNTDVAIGSYLGALRLNPDYAPTLHGLGIAYSKAGMRPEAIEAWRRVKKLDDTFDFEKRVVIDFDQ